MTKEYIIVNGVPILRSLIAETAKELPYDNTKSQLVATNSQDAIDEINGKISGVLVPTVLWTNADVGVNFESNTITLAERYDNYDYIEIVYCLSTSSRRQFTTGLIPVSSAFSGSMDFSNYLNASRNYDFVNGNQITISNNVAYKVYNNLNGTVENSLVIPYKIIGFKSL